MMPLMGYSGGRTRAARSASAMPQEWKCSTERCVRFCPLGMRCGAVRRSISAQDIPRSPRSTASATPTGPPPTMTTWYRFIAGAFRLDPRRLMIGVLAVRTPPRRRRRTDRLLERAGEGGLGVVAYDLRNLCQGGAGVA